MDLPYISYRSYRKFLFLAILSFIALTAWCQNPPVKNALVIGIDKYNPPPGAKVSNASGRMEWPELEGCRNDAAAIKEMIIARFGFQSKHITELYDYKATRQAILTAMEDLLKRTPENGIALIYYAGHGSFIRNSMSKEADKYDESIVPSDTWKEGVPDIRDKEIARIFNQFVDKKIKLTAIFDCCHSGSIARGIYPGKSRYIKGSNYDVKDSSTVIPPETRPNANIIILSAAQDDEPAKEYRLDYGEPPHGVFTLALLETLKQQSVKASVQNIFNNVRAMIKSFGKSQEPVLAGDVNRFNETLLGIDKGFLSDRLSFPVIAMKDSSIILQAGWAAGVRVGNELMGEKDSTVKIKITNLLGLGKSEAKLLSGDISNLSAAGPFELSNWVSASTPLLTIYIPESQTSYKEIMDRAAINMALQKSGKFNFIHQFDLTPPDIIINFSEGKPVANDFTTHLLNIPIPKFSVSEIENLASNKNLFVNLAPPEQLISTLKNKFKNFTTIRLANNPNDATYILYGTTDENGNPAYGLVKADITGRDSLSSLPLYTKPVTLSANSSAAYENVTDNIFEQALKISKIRGWLTLAAPQDGGFFPYRLEMRDATTDKIIDSNGVKIGTRLDLRIEANDDYLDYPIPRKYIYVFTIDVNGRMQLIYPLASEGSSQNKFPINDDQGMPQKVLSLFSRPAKAALPTGTDQYFLLASEEPIQSPGMLFNQKGVRATLPGNHPLATLLKMGNESNARSAYNTTPANWNLVKLSIKVIQ